jgi:hypothetical protein
MNKSKPYARIFWTLKEFKTREQMDKWVLTNKHKYQIEEIFVDNGFCVEYKPLIVIDIK